MKGSYTLFASAIAASTVALSSSSSSSSRDRDLPHYVCSNEGGSYSSAKDGANSSRASSDKEKFAPRFDGLRFIETLVTAHR